MLVYNTEDKYQMLPDEKLKLQCVQNPTCPWRGKVLSHYCYIQVCRVVFFFFTLNFFYFLFSCLNLFLSSWRTEKWRGGGLSPVGKVKLPATELCIKPLLWQLKLTPVLCPQCSLLLFLHPPSSFLLSEEVTAFICVVITIFVAVHAYCVLVWVVSR